MLVEKKANGIEVHLYCYGVKTESSPITDSLASCIAKLTTAPVILRQNFGQLRLFRGEKEELRCILCFYQTIHYPITQNMFDSDFTVSRNTAEPADTVKHICAHRALLRLPMMLANTRYNHR